MFVSAMSIIASRRVIYELSVTIGLNTVSSMVVIMASSYTLAYIDEPPRISYICGRYSQRESAKAARVKLSPRAKSCVRTLTISGYMPSMFELSYCRLNTCIIRSIQSNHLSLFVICVSLANSSDRVNLCNQYSFIYQL